MLRIWRMFNEVSVSWSWRFKDCRNNNVRFAGDSDIIGKTWKELEDWFGTGWKYGMEINVDKSQAMRVSRKNESLRIKVGNR